MTRFSKGAALAIAFSVSAATAADRPPGYYPAAPPPIAMPSGPPCAQAVVAGLTTWPEFQLLNVRIGPDETFPVVASVGNGQALLVCGRTGDWFGVLDPACLVGAPCIHGWAHTRWIVRAA